MYRLPTELETCDAYEIIEQAIAERRIVDVSFFEVLRYKTGPKRGYERHFTAATRIGRLFGKRPMLTAVPVRRLVEPVAGTLRQTRAGHFVVDVISRSSPGEELPAARTIRLDRIAMRAGAMRLRITSSPYEVTGTGLDPTVTHG